MAERVEARGAGEGAGGARARRREGGASASASGSEDGGGGGAAAGGWRAAADARCAAAAAALEVVPLDAGDIERCIAEAGKASRREVKAFVARAQAAGWSTRALQLSPAERTGYCLQ